MQNERKIKLILWAIIALAVTESLLFFWYFSKSGNPVRKNKNDCAVTAETKYVRGFSMGPIFKPEQEITALYGYYNCNKIEREDIVLLNYPGNNSPLIKMVKMIPDDKFHIEKNGEDKWNIIVNGEILKNSEGFPYQIDEKKALLLESYAKQYGGVVPANFYYVLGNILEGTVDSTRFGFVSRFQILAKVET